MKSRQELTFLLTDLDYKIVDSEELIIKLFGKTNEHEILVEVSGFKPYLYVKKSKEVEFILKNDPIISRWQTGFEEVVLRRYFWAGEELKLYKIFGKDPRKIREIAREFEKLGLETFETDIPYLKRFLIDNNIKCLNVVRANVITLEEKGRTIFAKANYKELYTVSDSIIPSPVLFYPLKVMGIKVEITREEESIEELLAKRKNRIIAISAIWGKNPQPQDGKLFLLQENSDDAEKRMIMDFIKYIHTVQPDILCTYRGDSFDLPYFFSRMKFLGIPHQLLSIFKDEPAFYSRQLLSYRIKGRMSFDLALRTWGIHPTSGRKDLYSTSQEVLGRGELKGLPTPTKLWQEGVLQKDKDNLKSLVKTCLHDCKLIFDLYWALGMTGWIETLRVTGFPTAESNSCTERINGEFELMRYMRRKGILIPKRPDKLQVEKNRAIRETHPHEGGTVLYPKGTLHTGVIIADFRSMYPSVMVAHNIGGETLKQWIEASDYGDPKKLFEKQSRSCLSILEETMVQKRLAKKEQIKKITEELEKAESTKEKTRLIEMLGILKREQNSMKIVANSLYGAHFYIRSRFYTQTLASAIADSARSYLLSIEKNLESISKKIVPCEMIYGDTDSTFIKILDEELIKNAYLESDPEKKERYISKLMKIAQAILKELNNNFPHPLELKLEDIAYRVIFKPERKKAYSYVSLLSDEFKVKGFEAVRSDWSPLARIAQRKVLDILLRYPKNSKGVTLPSTTNNSQEFKLAKQFLISLGARVLQISIEELLPKVLIMTPIRRDPDNYRTKTPSVYAFEDFAEKEQLDARKEWMNFDKFPWIITEGKGAIYRRAKHPKFVETIDREYYVTEMLRCCEDLGVKSNLKEVESALPTGRLDQFFGLATEQEINEPGQIQEGNIESEEILEIIKPINKGELEWRNKKKGIRRNVIHQRAAGQAALTIFAEEKESEITRDDEIPH
ncbi:MAG: hypothetical protein FK734_03245 [Asgard group archaeon]|nr:hypothetical protein [Asgard group archaeon]